MQNIRGLGFRVLERLTYLAPSTMFNKRIYFFINMHGIKALKPWCENRDFC